MSTTTSTTTTTTTTTSTTTTTAAIFDSVSVTNVCNMALARFGGKKILDYTDDSENTVQHIQCRLHYPQTRNALMRSHLWRFARARVGLTQAGGTPPFEYDYKYALPRNYLRIINLYNGDDTRDGRPLDSYTLEGKYLLSNEDTAYLRYIRLVVDPDDWDPLFVEVLVLRLAQKLVVPLSQDMKLKRDIDQELDILMRKVRALDWSESKKLGRNDLRAWREARSTDVP